MTHRAISPLDGRYHSKTAPLADYLSEWALMKYRVLVEVAWLIAMSESPHISDVRELSADEKDQLQRLVTQFDDASADKIKQHERTTNHDVKAVEYFIKDEIAQSSLVDVSEYVHFCCTSADINNLAYGLMLKHAIEQVWLPQAIALVEQLQSMADTLADVAMLARTHGQPATPTTMGKELAVFAYRLQRQLKQLKLQEYLGKFSGAIGAYNAHLVAYPDVDWVMLSREFVEELGLVHNPLTTQIESHDYQAELAHNMMRFNTIVLDLCRDMWMYISINTFKQRVIAGEVGSSTMPHKVNPIDFENAEANAGISNATLSHLADKLPVSRYQRDLSDSSAMRNFGVSIAHSYLMMLSTQRGLAKVDINPIALSADLDDAWEVLGEAVQTILRKYRIPNAYEQLKELTRGSHITQAILHEFIDGLAIPDADKQRLLQLTPATYLGLANQLAKLE
jgi:adenylosuccinate lyase